MFIFHRDPVEPTLGKGWELPGFKDSGWTRGISGFGAPGTPNSIPRTEWFDDGIWLRRTFDLKAVPLSMLLRYYHDEDAEVYING